MIKKTKREPIYKGYVDQKSSEVVALDLKDFPILKVTVHDFENWLGQSHAQ